MHNNSNKNRRRNLSENGIYKEDHFDYNERLNRSQDQEFNYSYQCDVQLDMFNIHQDDDTIVLVEEQKDGMKDFGDEEEKELYKGLVKLDQYDQFEVRSNS